MIIKPGRVVDFLIANQNVRDPFSLDWSKRNANNLDGEDEVKVTVYDYFVKHHHIELSYSGDLPCINVGKPKRPTYFPLELCSLVSLQRYTKALSTLQRSSLVEKLRQKPNERMKILSDALKSINYGSEPTLHSCGISINTNFTQVEDNVDGEGAGASDDGADSAGADAGVAKD
ncbi:Protein argonaute 4 [Morella rubra]|uniref:Protein argonaute 4 n=1 Tax=Morella rubra TaxID=262757 RepID=A0A6A1UT32_9ROSI|nr:Protein argonaute 4 [Morella rubra]